MTIENRTQYSRFSDKVLPFELSAMAITLPPNTTLRRDVVETDCACIGTLVSATGMFSQDEVAIAIELVEERLLRGRASGYEFLILETEQTVVGYSCYGLIPCSTHSFDLYWIVVDPDRQRTGLGRLLMRLSEEAVVAAGGANIYIDTSGQTAYEGTRRFYQRCGYELAAELPDFYAPGDSKHIYRRQLVRQKLVAD